MSDRAGKNARLIITHEDYLVAVTTAVCEQYPTTAAALSEVQLVFGTGPRRRALDPLHRAWMAGKRTSRYHWWRSPPSAV